MTSRYLKAVRLAVIAAPAALLMGCAAPAGDQTLQSDVAALKSDMQKVLKGIDDLKAADKQQVDRMDLINKYAESAATKADAAQKAAEAAMAEAKKASQKVDEAFRKSLRK